MVKSVRTAGNRRGPELRLNQVRQTRALAVLVALGLAISGCDASGGSPTTIAPLSDTSGSSEGREGTDIPPPEPFVAGEFVRLDLPRAEVRPSDVEIAAVVRADRALGLDLLGVAAGDRNTMLSPYSIATALSMLYAGARGQTAAEIRSVLNLSVDDETLHEVRNSIDSELSSPAPPQGEDDTRRPFAIRPANSVWGQGGYPFLDPYLNVLVTHYGAGLRLLDYVRDPAGATDTINNWTEDVTEGRIENLIPDNLITELTRLVLVNAIWFEANWAEEFDPEATSDGAFTLLDGSQTNVPLMHTSIRTGFVDSDSFQAVRLPYAGDAAMVIVLPKSGTPQDLAATLGVEVFDLDWSDSLVELTMPRFEFDSEVGLKKALQDLGMRAVFVPPWTGSSDEADLTGITIDRVLYVSEALHKTFVSVDEHGTEAAAATAMIITMTSAPTPVTLSVDRPFLFWIEHTSTGEPLFLGQVTDPNAN